MTWFHFGHRLEATGMDVVDPSMEGGLLPALPSQLNKRKLGQVMDLLGHVQLDQALDPIYSFEFPEE